jgi:dUTP pyrophosphatase
MKVKIKRLHSSAQLPAYIRPGDSAMDLFACLEETIKIPPGERRIIQCGFALEMPEGYGMFIIPRSGLSVRHGVTVHNAPGLVDTNFRGEVRVIVHNEMRMYNESFEVFHGARIAQALILPVPTIEWVEVRELSESARGDKGFGSSGV